MSARLLTPAYRAAMLGGTAGRPNVVATTLDENGRIVVVYADGCMAVRVYRAGVHVWQGMEGPNYDEMFTVPADVPVADMPKVGVWNGHGVWICGCDGFVERSKHGVTETACCECGVIRPALPDGTHWCECPFPTPSGMNRMVCTACGGWR